MIMTKIHLREIHIAIYNCTKKVIVFYHKINCKINLKSQIKIFKKRISLIATIFFILVLSNKS